MEGAKINKITEYVKKDLSRFLLIGLAFSLPFERIPSFDVLGITVRLSVIFSVLIILRTLYLFYCRKIKLSFAFYDKIMIAFICWIALIIPVSINLNRAFGVFVFVLFSVVTAYCISLIFRKEYIRPIVSAMFFASAIVVAFGIYQYLGDIFNLPPEYTGLRDRYTWKVFGFPRIQAFSLEPLYMAAFLLLPFSYAVVQLLSKKSFYSNIVLLLIILLNSFAIFMSVSRGGIYAMIFAGILISLFLLFRKKTSLVKIIKLAVLILISFGISLVIINYFNKPASSFTEGKRGTSAFVDQLQNTSIGEGDERSVARKKALSILNENKSAYIFGIGPGQYGPYAQNNNTSPFGWTIVNNLTIELLLETGLIGISLVLIFIASLAYKSFFVYRYTRNNYVELAILGTWMYLSSQAVQVQTYSTLYILVLWFPIGIIMGVLRGTNLRISDVKKTK